MATSTSSADPAALLRYVETAASLNGDLGVEAGQLSTAIDYFLATCTEYSISIDRSLVDDLRGYLSDVSITDEWVREVAIHFQLADQWGGLLASLPGFIKADQEFLNLIKDFTGGRTGFRENLLQLGRFLNRVTGVDGNVGRMGNFYRFWSQGIPYRGNVDSFLRSPVFQKGFIVVDVVVNVINDWRDNAYEGDKTKIIGVNILDAGVKGLIILSEVGAIVLIVNSIIQVAGNIQVAIQRTVSGWIAPNGVIQQKLMHDAERVADAVKRMDLGNISKEIAETLYDVGATPYVDSGRSIVNALKEVNKDRSLSNLQNILHNLEAELKPNRDKVLFFHLSPAIAVANDPRGRQGVKDTGRAVLNVVDGTLDYIVATGASVSNMKVAVEAQVLHLLPVSDEFKLAVDRAARDYMDRTQEMSDKVINFWKL